MGGTAIGRPVRQSLRCGKLHRRTVALKWHTLARVEPVIDFQLKSLADNCSRRGALRFSELNPLLMSVSQVFSGKSVSQIGDQVFQSFLARGELLQSGASACAMLQFDF